MAERKRDIAEVGEARATEGFVKLFSKSLDVFRHGTSVRQFDNRRYVDDWECCEWGSHGEKYGVHQSQRHDD